MLNQVLEATLALMILLLALSVSVIVRIRPTAAGSTEASADSEAAGPAGTSVPPPDAVWSGPLPGAIAASVPPVSKPDRLVPGRYEARHVRGHLPGQRPPGPAGPPWGPAVPPPGQPQQGSERLT